MTVTIKPISEINHQANEAFIGALGVVDTIRFMNKLDAGSCDDAFTRVSLFQDMTAKEIIAEIKSRRSGCA